MKPAASSKKTLRRVVLGEGYPSFSSPLVPGAPTFSTVQLFQEKVHPSILFRGGEHLVSIDPQGTGNWNKVRLVLEILE